MGCNRHLTRQLRTGELVDRWQVLVKQVDALPGDKVAIGKDVFTVPEGCCYVLRQSGGLIDLRYWEDPFVPLDGIKAKLIIIHLQYPKRIFGLFEHIR